MRVLIVHYSKLDMGGAEVVVSKLSKYLEEVGIKHKVVQSSNPIVLFEETLRLSSRYDVINVHNFPSTFAAFPKQKPIVWMCNEPPELFTTSSSIPTSLRKPIEWVHRLLVNKLVDRVIVADKFNAERFEGIYGIRPATIPYGVDYKFWSIREEHLLTPGYPVLLQVGTITPYKNQLESVKVFKALQSKYRDLELWLVGLDSDKMYLSEVKKLIGGDGKVRFTIGWVSPSRRRALYNISSVLLHPVKPQGGWLVPFEAICAGIPVIVGSEFTGVDLIKNNGLGWVGKDTSEYSDVISHILDEGVKLEDMEGRKKWVKENLTWDKFGENMVKVFREVL